MANLLNLRLEDIPEELNLSDIHKQQHDIIKSQFDAHLTEATLTYLDLQTDTILETGNSHMRQYINNTYLDTHELREETAHCSYNSATQKATIRATCKFHNPEVLIHETAHYKLRHGDQPHWIPITMNNGLRNVQYNIGEFEADLVAQLTMENLDNQYKADYSYIVTWLSRLTPEQMYRTLDHYKDRRIVLHKLVQHLSISINRIRLNNPSARITLAPIEATDELVNKIIHYLLKRHKRTMITKDGQYFIQVNPDWAKNIQTGEIVPIEEVEDNLQN